MNLAKIYEAYIACLNARELNRLDEYVGDSVIYNSSKIGLTGYRELLAGNYRDIPAIRPLNRRKQAALRLPTQGRVSRAPSRRKACRVSRERLLSVCRGQNSGGLVGDR
jgi:hypothetical protein